MDDIILVDGHSTDGTVEAAKRIRPDINVRCQPNRGKGDALKYGVAICKGDIVVTLDGDATYSPEEMSRFVEAILQGNDFAKGTRFKGMKPTFMSVRRQVGNRILVLATNTLFRTNYTDVCSGFYAFQRRVFSRANLTSDGFDMEQELFVKIAKMKLKVADVPHSYHSRTYGDSKTQDFRQGIKDLLWIISFLFRS